MTHIDFFSNAPNRLDYVVRLLQKVLSAQQTAVVCGKQNTINQLSQALWQLDGFCAHDIYPEQNPTVLNAPIILVSEMPSELPHYLNLINLSDQIPINFASFKRLIEVVPDDDIPRQAARDRWSFYKNRGYKLTHHNIASKKA